MAGAGARLSRAELHTGSGPAGPPSRSSKRGENPQRLLYREPYLPMPHLHADPNFSLACEEVFGGLPKGPSNMQAAERRSFHVSSPIINCYFPGESTQMLFRTPQRCLVTTAHFHQTWGVRARGEWQGADAASLQCLTLPCFWVPAGGSLHCSVDDVLSLACVPGRVLAPGGRR